MPSGGQIVRLAEDAVGPPDHQVRRALGDLPAAAGAAVALQGRCGRVLLHVPLPVAALLGATHTGQRTTEVDRLGVRVSAPGTRVIGAGHTPMLRGSASPFRRRTVAALAATTSSVQLSTLVTGNTYRDPTLLAKTVSTLDVIGHGRAILGAGWFELEQEQLGFDFDTFTERFEKLDEALQIIHPMLRDERPEFTGTWYRAYGAMNSPRFRDSVRRRSTVTRRS